MDELAALAAAAAATVVTAMATDAWQGVRDAVTGLFHLSRRRRADIRDRLDGNADLVARAAVPDQARQALLGVWTLEMSALLSEDPSSREPLARLVAEYGVGISEDRRGFVVAQTNTAYGFGTVFGVQGGAIHVHSDHSDHPVEGSQNPHVV